MDDQGLTERGIAALRAGDREAARALLAAAVRRRPDDARAWLWLSGAVSDPAAQRYCLERVLALDPGCAPARAGLEALEAGDHGQPRVVAQPADATAPVAAPAPAARPWRLIWHRPRAAFRAALAGRPAWEPWLLAALAGAGAALAWGAMGELGAALGPLGLLALAAAAGAPLGAAGLLLGGVLLRTGGWLLGGRAGAAQVRAALGWALAPATAGLPLWLAWLALAAAGAGQAQGLLVGALGAAQAGLWLWSAALSVVGLAEAHRLSLWRAAASWLAAALAALAGAGAMLGGAALVIELRGG